MAHYQTIHGFNDDEVISTIQKEIRRGLEQNAMYWALELAETGKSSFGVLVSRLKVILYEDIGLGDPDIILRVSKAIDDMKDMYKSNTGDWKMVLSFIILSLCRAKKSRITDHFKESIVFSWENISSKELDMKIPDYALDMHTSKGNLMGRTKGSSEGVEHFIKVGEYLNNENPELKDIYKAEALKIWRQGKK
jgi:replication-associated recombination protein RarA